MKPIEIRAEAELDIIEAALWYENEREGFGAKESVANVSQIVTLDKSELTVRVGKLPKAKLELVLSGVDVILGR
jgi:mRNA-degrading endonuclease toxin of MazEF toxin-antitoxin module